jgi:imidazole glycerol-phosphate synthase subunit HisH
MLVIIDFGMGNLRSVYNKMKRLGCDVRISTNSDEIASADKLILPGVGNFAIGIKKLRERKQVDLIRKKVLMEKIPILGICLGMQLLSRLSEEGESEGLKLIDAKTVRFRIPEVQKYKLKVPHIGWNSVKMEGKSVLMKNIPENSLFYFIHSYHYVADNPDFITGSTYYGYDFISLIEQGNIFGTQFHPEKSQDAGIQLLENFILY